VNTLQARILEAGKKKVDTRPRTNFICTKWSSDNQSGELADGTGYRFGVVSDDLAPECEGHLQPGEKVSGLVEGPHISNIIVESGERAIGNIAERKEFDSVGPAPEVRGWNPHRGTPGIGHIRFGK
jgi:hypothetical protein